MDKESTDITDINSRLANIDETLGNMNNLLSNVVATERQSLSAFSGFNPSPQEFQGRTGLFK